jgi:hypothetical protein
VISEETNMSALLVSLIAVFIMMDDITELSKEHLPFFEAFKSTLPKELYNNPVFDFETMCADLYFALGEYQHLTHNLFDRLNLDESWLEVNGNHFTLHIVPGVRVHPEEVARSNVMMWMMRTGIVN